MDRKKKRLFKKGIAITLIVCFSIGVAVSAWAIGIVAGSKVKILEYEQWQENHLEELRPRLLWNYAQRDFSGYCDFDLNQAYLDGVKYNDVQFLATHNSYKDKPGPLMYAFELLNYSNYGYYFDPLYDQLDKGIFSLELDVYPTETGFLCMHKTYGDIATTGYNMALALEEIAIWSSCNVGHLPITIMIEPKGWVLKNKDAMNMTDPGVMERFDELLLDTFGDKLYTPADMLGDTYDNLSEAAAADAWPTLLEMKDKIMVFEITDRVYQYIDLDPSMKTQKMFPAMKMLLADKYEGYEIHRAVTWIDETFEMDKQELLKAEKKGTAKYDVSELFQQALAENLFIRTRIDMYEYYSETAVPLVIAAGGNVLATDYPPHNNDRTDYVIPLDKTVFLKSN